MFLAVMPGTLAQRIVAARKTLGLTQAQLAAQVGVNVMTVWRWEKGKSTPTGAHLLRLQELFGW